MGPDGKHSGIGIADRPWSLGDNMDIILTAIDIFGPNRVMFASNFPVDGLRESSNTIFSEFDEAIQYFGTGEGGFLFWRTPAKTYRLPVP
ncbi:MAG: amidohydrolase family protein [Hyphomicrobiales bacterium]